ALAGAPRDGVKAAAAKADEGTDPPGDTWASPDFRRHLARVLTERAVGGRRPRDNPPMSTPPLVDGFGRTHRSLRLSVTDRCNLRCRYCMPAEGMAWIPREGLLTDDALLGVGGSPGGGVPTAAGVWGWGGLFAGLGVTELGVPGGEPLVRPGLPGLIG